MDKTLLVIDDAVIVREKIKETARAAGWEIVGEASNGKEGVRQYAELRPVAVTLDLVMPEFDGIYALREILATDSNAKVVVVQRTRTEERAEGRIQAGRRRLRGQAFRPSHAGRHLGTIRRRRRAGRRRVRRR